MRVYLGADHRGFLLKDRLRAWLVDKQVDVTDCGAEVMLPEDDYVDIASIVAEKVATDSQSRGILLCGSGSGVSIAANKRSGIRAAVGWRPDQVVASVSDDDINILALPADYISEKEAQDLINAFLSTEFIPEDRYLRRIAKIKELESHA